MFQYRSCMQGWADRSWAILMCTVPDSVIQDVPGPVIVWHDIQQWFEGV